MNCHQKSLPRPSATIVVIIGLHYLYSPRRCIILRFED